MQTVNRYNPVSCVQSNQGETHRKEKDVQANDQRRLREVSARADGRTEQWKITVSPHRVQRPPHDLGLWRCPGPKKPRWRRVKDTVPTVLILLRPKHRLTIRDKKYNNRKNKYMSQYKENPCCDI